jgi:hypothetical protein
MSSGWSALLSHLENDGFEKIIFTQHGFVVTGMLGGWYGFNAVVLPQLM